MLNLTKCLLAVNGLELGTQQEYHGLTLTATGKHEVQIRRKPGALNYFSELADYLGKPMTNGSTCTLVEMAAGLPEIHEIAFTLGHVPKRRRRFLPVEIDFKVNESRTAVFTEIRYHQRNVTRVDTSKFLKGKRKDYFKTIPDDGQWVRFRSKKRKRLTRTNWSSVYRNIGSEFSAFDLSLLLTREGYRYYCNLDPGPTHHLSTSFMLMFYVGSAARYRPHETRELLSGELKPLVAEAVDICPQQYLYQLTSYITRSVCAVPQAKFR